MAWTGPKPDAGLHAAARRARHALIRRGGARAQGPDEHHARPHRRRSRPAAADSRAEKSRPGPARAECRPRPLSPRGAGVVILRPLLVARRATVRAASSTAGSASGRRSRRSVGRRARPPAPGCGSRRPLRPACAPADGTAAARLAARACSADRRRPSRLRADALRAAPAATASRVLGRGRCSRRAAASGRRRDRVRALGRASVVAVDFLATLAGARLTSRRRPSEVARECGRGHTRKARVPCRSSPAAGRSRRRDASNSAPIGLASTSSPLARPARLPRPRAARSRHVPRRARAARAARRRRDALAPSAFQESGGLARMPRGRAV